MASDSAIPPEGEQPENVPTVTVAEKSHALTTTVFPSAHTNVIQRPQPKAMDGKATSTDVTGNLMKGVKNRFETGLNEEYANAIERQWTNQSNAARLL